MGLRCLLGHNFGTAEIERERKEDGNQVVVTVQEIKRCQRCDERLVMSENKEVTSVDQLTKAANGTVDPRNPDTDVGPDTATDSGAESSSADPPASAVSDLAEIPDAEPERGSASDAARDSDSVSADTPESASDITRDSDSVSADTSGDEAAITDASDDAAIILDDEDDPESEQPDSTGDSEPAMTTDSPRQSHPSVETESEPARPNLSGIEASAETGADSQSDDGVILDDEPTTDPADRGPGEWPDPPDQESQTDDDSSSQPDIQQESQTEDFEPWPEQVGEDEGFSAKADSGNPSGVSTDTASGLPAEDGQDEAVSIGFQSESRDTTPEQPTSVDDAHTGVERTEAGVAHSNPSDADAESAGVTLEYLCPDCGHVEQVRNSPLRAGDICPECQRGFISERQV